MNYKRDNMICPYEHYYSNQAGSGVGIIYRGVAHQRGHGIGSFLGGLFRSVFPLLTSGAKAVGKEALSAGVGVLSDMINQARPIKESLKSHFKDASANLKRKADNKINSFMSGSGYKIKRLNKKHITSSKSSKRRGANNKAIAEQKDIFSK